MGRLHPVKDVDTLLAASARLPELSLVVVGDGPERGRLEAKAAQLGVSDASSFWAQSSRVADVLRACDSFALSSHGEGMSNALLEAMACGLPCLVSRIRLEEHVSCSPHGRGLLVADGDPAAWTAAIERVAAAWISPLRHGDWVGRRRAS